MDGGLSIVWFVMKITQRYFGTLKPDLLMTQLQYKEANLVMKFTLVNFSGKYGLLKE